MGSRAMSADLLRTKLYRPVARLNLVTRSRLLRRLDAGLRSGPSFARRLTLVAAPAGFGKTTLVAAWVAGIDSHADGPAVQEAGPSVCWLSLDDADNDPARFLRYLVAALEPTIPGLGHTLTPQVLVQADTTPALTQVLGEVINVVAEASTPVVLVLDDYHVIHSAGIEALMAFLLDHQPATLHLVVATRSDPALPLSRLRARGQLLELRVHDLRFTEAEAAEFLTHTMGLSLQPGWIAALEQRTEGWIAGLQLAALSLHGRADAETFIEAFSGSHRYVIDYLVDEVLSHQPQEVRDFLVQTSVLDRFCAPLCGALLTPSLPQSAGPVADAQHMLERLERANLFLIPLDDRRQWYRYHHLFADSLRATLDAAQQRDLHQRAALWFEAHRLSVESVAHGLASGDLEFAAGSIERAVQDPATWSGGQLATLVSWLDALPDAILEARPVLSLHASRSLYLSGRLAESERLLNRAVQGLEHSAGDDGEAGPLLALADVYRGAIAALRGQVAQAIVYARQGLAHLPESAHHARARAHDTLGLAHQLSGDLGQAEQYYLQAGELAQTAGVAYLAINARCEAAGLQLRQGRLTDAARTCQEALQLSERPIPPQGLAWIVLGEIAREQHDLASAEHAIQEGLDLAQQGGLTDELRVALIALAWLKHDRDDAEGARRALEQAAVITRSYGVERLTLHMEAHQARLDLAQGHMEAHQARLDLAQGHMEAHQARLDLAQGHTAAAARWAEIYREHADRDAGYLRDFEELTLARAYLAMDQAGSALDVLECVLAEAEKCGRGAAIVEAQILLALAYDQDGRIPEATGALGRAVVRAAPEQWLRPFLDGGRGMAALLSRVRSRAPAFVDALLSILGTQPAAPEISEEALHAGPQPTIEILGELLSEREREILRLLAEGQSNREIGQTLFIGVGTVKWYLTNLYDKLDVGSRAQAVARARAHGLI